MHALSARPPTVLHQNMNSIGSHSTSESAMGHQKKGGSSKSQKSSKKGKVVCAMLATLVPDDPVPVQQPLINHLSVTLLALGIVQNPCNLKASPVNNSKQNSSASASNAAGQPQHEGEDKDTNSSASVGSISVLPTH